MNYTTTSVGKVTAHITNKKSRLKVYNGHIVFLKDKDNFEFEIHNPTQKSILCKIKLNGDYISASGIVIRPGQRVFLDRFLDTNNKFEFSTYDVKDTSENRSAIDLNGDIRIEFYDEQSKRNNYGVYNYNKFWTTSPITTGSITYGPIFTTSSCDNTHYSSGSFTNSVPYNSPNSIETGRIEKGETSDQKFVNSYEQFEYFTSHQISLKILPIGNRSITSEDIKQYCHECGTKTKKNHKFCPSCGNKL